MEYDKENYRFDLFAVLQSISEHCIKHEHRLYPVVNMRGKYFRTDMILISLIHMVTLYDNPDRVRGFTEDYLAALLYMEHERNPHLYPWKLESKLDGYMAKIDEMRAQFFHQIKCSPDSHGVLRAAIEYYRNTKTDVSTLLSATSPLLDNQRTLLQLALEKRVVLERDS